MGGILNLINRQYIEESNIYKYKKMDKYGSEILSKLTVEEKNILVIRRQKYFLIV